LPDTHIHIHLNGEGGQVVSTSPKKSSKRRPASPTKKVKKSRKKDPKMARAMKKAHAKAKKKDGSFRSGWDQGKLMAHAHKLKRKM
jgi:hypothetical protein